MKNVLIADCGATKCEWAELENGVCVRVVETDGFNPNVYQAQDILQKLKSCFEDSSIDKKAWDKIYFFGAGCGTKHGNKVVTEALESIVPTASVKVSNDIMGTALALYNQKPLIACILGTGSASVYFNGKEVKQLRSSLGWTIGDEGSGCAIGKRILRNIYYKIWSPELVSDFYIMYPGIDIDAYLNELRSNPAPNKFIASFAPFAKKHLVRPEVYEEVYAELKQFIQWQVTPFCKEYNCGAAFSGSVAHHFEEILRRIAQEEGIEIDKVIAKPLPELVKAIGKRG